MLVAAPKMTSPSASAPRLDDASMTYLGRAEAIIRDEVGVDELEKRQENQLTAFKVFFCSCTIYHSKILIEVDNIAQWLKWFCEAGGGGLTRRSQVGANPIPIPTPLIWRYLGINWTECEYKENCHNDI